MSSTDRLKLCLIILSEAGKQTNWSRCDASFVQMIIEVGMNLMGSVPQNDLDLEFLKNEHQSQGYNTPSDSRSDLLIHFVLMLLCFANNRKNQCKTTCRALGNILEQPIYQQTTSMRVSSKYFNIKKHMNGCAHSCLRLVCLAQCQGS